VFILPTAANSAGG